MKVSRNKHHRERRMFMETKQRWTWIDMAKGYGILFVILAHLDEGALRIALYTFHLPLFLFLSGYLFRPRDSFGAFLKNKALHLLVPYFCLGIPMAIFDGWYTRVPGTSMWPRVLDNCWALLEQNRFWTLWYIACLFLLNLLFYALVRFLKSPKVLAAVVLLLTVGGVCYAKYVAVPLPWNLDVVFPSLLFFYAGYLTQKTGWLTQTVFPSRWKPLLFLGAVAVDVGCQLLNNALSGEYLQLFEATYGIPVFTYLGAFAGILAVLLLSQVCTLPPIRYIGENSLPYFAWHQTILFPLADLFYQKTHLFQQMFLSRPQYYGKLFCTLLFTCLLLTAASLLIKHSFLRFMVGDFSRKPKQEPTAVS